MKNKPILILSLIILVTLGLNACSRSERVEAAREPDSVNDRRDILTEDENDFIAYASEMHAGEIDMAQQAKQKSSNEDVREYADAVIRLHSDALKELSNNFEQNGVPQSRTASLDTKSHIQYLSPMSGAQFDQEFIALMIADHQSASDTFRDEINTTQNRDMKSYLRQDLRDLETGLNDGKELRGKLTGEKPTN